MIFVTVKLVSFVTKYTSGVPGVAFENSFIASLIGFVVCSISSFYEKENEKAHGPLYKSIKN